VGARESVVDARDIYRLYFHGPAYQVVAEAWRDENRIFGRLSENLPNNHHPSDQPALIEPRLIELCFQTAGLWEMALQGRMGLPRYVGSVSLQQSPQSAEGPFHAVVAPVSNEESFDAQVVDAHGNCLLRLLGYRTVALPNSVDANR